MTPARKRLVVTSICAVVLLVVAASQFRSVAQAQPGTTPGMLFGPLFVDRFQHIELCSSFLSEGTLTQAVHFRNLTTGEVTASETITFASGSGKCATYYNSGHVIGMARAVSPASASEWNSASNALIGTMSVVDDRGAARVSVLGVAKFWLVGL